MPNTFEDAAEILREIKDEVDRLQEERTAEGPVNIYRGATDSTVSADTVSTTVDDAASFTWDESRWGHAEFGE